MKAPSFWSATGGAFWPVILSPLGAVYGAVQALRQKISHPVDIGIPVICIGNFVAGGAGKTPTALAIAELLLRQGLNVHFLSRGYGGRLKGPVKVDAGVHTHLDVGDEPLILTKTAPCWVAIDRVAGAKAAKNEEADVIIMDDGFQNPHLAKDISLLVIDTVFGFGNGKLIPAGPLREAVSVGQKRANAIVLIGNNETFPGSDLIDRSKPVLRGRLLPTDKSMSLAGEKVIAFAGIGRPAKFFDSLTEAGCDIVGRKEFPDHHRYGDDDFVELVDLAFLHSAKLVTTRKDYMRLSDEFRLMVDVFDVVYYLESEDEITSFLMAGINQKREAIRSRKSDMYSNGS